MLSVKVRGQETPFSQGVNLTSWFQAESAQQIQFTKFTKKDFENIQSLGCDVIRLPINLHAMTSGSPDYTLDPLFLEFLDEATDWAESLEMHLIFDNHTFDPAVNTDPSIEDALLKVWTQMAEHFKDRSNYIYYEVLNEPHGIDDEVWGTIQQNVIDAIREVDTKHTIIVGPASWNSYNNLQHLPEYEDDNLIYTFHFYDPFIFTHQGASWTDPSMVPLAGVPFPYNADEMPDAPPELQGTWIEGSMNNYVNEGTIERVKELIDIAVDFSDNRNVPIFCGEFGVYMNNSDNDDRVYWYEVVRDYFEEKNISWTMWDYTGGFGLFEVGGNDLFEHDLNIPLIKALEFNEVEQTGYEMKPDSTGFDIYTDYISEHAVEASNAGEGQINYYNKNAFDGKYCIQWNDADQYSGIALDFKPNKDLSYLVDNDYALAFWVKGNSANTNFDIRFLDTDTEDPDDHPWRIRYTIDESIVEWNGSWQPVQIPLKEFEEQGAWEDEWFDPQGDFDWKAIDRFEIIAEHGDLSGISLLFDNIRITNKAPQEPITGLDPSKTLKEKALFNIHPNPVNNSSQISYYLPGNSKVKITLLNVTGQKQFVLFNKNNNTGQHALEWQSLTNGLELPEGVYLCRMETSGYTVTRKILVR